MKRCEYVERKTPSKNILEFLKHSSSRSHHMLFFLTTLYKNIFIKGCAYKKGICAMCGIKMLKTKDYKQSSSWFISEQPVMCDYITVVPYNIVLLLDNPEELIQFFFLIHS